MSDEGGPRAEYSLEELEDMLVMLKEYYPDEREAMAEIGEEIRRRRAAEGSSSDVERQDAPGECGRKADGRGG